MLEPHLLLEGEVHGFGAHVKHAVHFFIYTVILEAEPGISITSIEKESFEAIYALPEAELGRGLPQLRNFILVASLDELVVDDKERVSGDIIWERRKGGDSWHIDIDSLLCVVEVES